MGLGEFNFLSKGDLKKKNVGANTYFLGVNSNFLHIIFKKHLKNTYKKYLIHSPYNLPNV